MDKLAKQLREDAERIDATISEELDNRIQASLQGVQPERTGGRATAARPRWFWWASSLTGVDPRCSGPTQMALREVTSTQLVLF